MSYRRQETAYAANWLYQRLAERFGDDQVFMDVDAIELGDDFVAAITTAVNSCDVLLALIGDQWLTITDSEGKRRIDDPHDFVHLEIKAALAHKVRIIPILVNGATMPRDADLPTSIARLAYRQALELNPNRFDEDLDPLLKMLDKTLSSSGDPTAADLHRTRDGPHVPHSYPDWRAVLLGALRCPDPGPGRRAVASTTGLGLSCPR